MKKINLITIITQAFYGNRTITEIRPEEMDMFILGHLDHTEFWKEKEKIDRTIIRIPNTDNLVLVYNKYEEEKRCQRKDELLKKENYVLKPLAIIPEINMELYSRCIVCRMNEAGEFESLEKEDFEKFMKYLAK